MSNILSMEFYRLKRSTLFWVLLAVTAALPLLSMLFEVAALKILGSLDSDTTVDIWQAARNLNLTAADLSAQGQMMPTSTLLSVIFTSIFLSRSFSYGTFRNTLLANHSRLELYLADILVAVAVGEMFLCTSILSTLLFVGSVFGFYEMTAAQIAGAIALSFAMGMVVMLFVQLMMCMLLFATRKLSATLSLTLVISLLLPAVLEGIVMFLELFGTLMTNGNFTVDESWIPILNTSLLDVSRPNGALVGKILLYMLPLEVLFGFLGWLGFRKANLK